MNKLNISEEEAKERVTQEDPDYELIEYENANNCLIRYNVTGEVFKSRLRDFTKKLHPKRAPSTKQARREATNMKKYGSRMPTGNKSVLENRNANNIEKYGAACIFASEQFKKDESIKKKKIETCKSNHGVEFPSQSKIVREKIKETLQKNYGVDSPQKSKELREKTERTCQEKYGAKSVLLNPEVQNKIIETKKKTGAIKTIEGKTFKEVAADTHRAYTTVQSKFKKDPNFNFEKYKKHSSDIEMLMSDFITSLGVDFRTQESLLGDRTKVDFFIPSRNLVIECNGSYWHCIKKKSEKYHFNRREALNLKGYRVLQFNEYDIKGVESFGKIKNIIRNALKMSAVKIYARDCGLKEISKEEYYRFCDDNHLMGRGKCSYAYGLFRNDMLVQIAGFVERESHIEIGRTCSLLEHSIVGGFSKLISKLPNKDLHTFIDLNYGEGKYLGDLGFSPQEAHVSFRWVDLNNKEFYGRMSFSDEVAAFQGLIKYFDAGQQRWIRKAK